MKKWSKFKYNGTKKRRGWRDKQFFVVKITQVTEDGFWLHNEGMDFYIRRKQFPWFLGATEKEIRDVRKMLDWPQKGSTARRGLLWWETLQISVPMACLKYPETLKVYTVYVRKETRDDLYEQHIQWLRENSMSNPR